MGRKSKIISPVNIVDVADKGKVIGKDEEGNVYLLSGALPGDVVSFLYKGKKKGMRTGRITEFVKKSEDRIAPTCPHFGICGGCKWQNLSYETQLKYKHKMVADAIRRIGKDDITVSPIVGSAKTLDYRNKLEFTFSSQRWLTKEEIDSDDRELNHPALGFHAPGSFNKVVHVDHCYLQEGLSNDILNFVRDFAAEHDLGFYEIKEHKGMLRNLIIRRTSLGHWMVILSLGGGTKVQIELMMSAIKERFPEITSLYYVVNQKWNDTLYDQDIKLYHGDADIVEALDHVKFSIGPKSFFQTNPEQAKVLYRMTKEAAQISKYDLVYDLYCGLGSISLYVADAAKHVVGIEEVPMAIEDAKKNMALNNIDNASFYAGNVRTIMTDEFVAEHGRPDVVITDPPRAGMHKDVVYSLLRLAAERIVYVSCNPATQARDIALLKEKYELVSVVPVDMFPQTAHVESVATLKLK